MFSLSDIGGLVSKAVEVARKPRIAPPGEDLTHYPE